MPGGAAIRQPAFGRAHAVRRHADTQGSSEAWSYVVGPRTGWIDFRLRELWAARGLVWLFVWRDFVALYKQTALGPLWYVVQPLLTSLVFTVVFGRIAQLPTDQLPQFLFYMSGTVVWSYFAACLTKVSLTFITNAQLFGKVYFPRAAVPLSLVVSGLIAFGIQLALLLGFIVYFMIVGNAVQPNAYALLFPVLLLITAALGLGAGLVVTSVTIRYRDLQYLLTFGVQLAMFLAPIVIPLSSVHGKLRWLMIANPMTSIVESFRFGLLGAGEVNPWQLAYSAGVAVSLCVVGLGLFNRVERTFMDTV